jgi:hypothetical protein
MLERQTSLDRSELAEMLLQGEELGSPTGVIAVPELLQWLRISIPARGGPTINSAAIVDSPSAHSHARVAAGQRSIGMFK